MHLSTHLSRVKLTKSNHQLTRAVPNQIVLLKLAVVPMTNHNSNETGDFIALQHAMQSTQPATFIY